MHHPFLINSFIRIITEEEILWKLQELIILLYVNSVWNLSFIGPMEGDESLEIWVPI